MIEFINKIKKPRWIILGGLLVLAIILIIVYLPNGRQIEVGGNENKNVNPKQGEIIQGGGISSLSGWACENYQQRPIAVVVAGDNVARPLSGISEADLVLEMPVISGSVTRLMAFYVCNSPKEIGSVRSARHDFVPLAMGYDAILAHWGGSHFILDQLNNKIMDNIDALPNPFDAFYMKKGLLQPHNGFTSMERLVNSAKKLGYRMKNNFESYVFKKDQPKMDSQDGILKIGYAVPYNLEYHYNPESNSYSRYRNGLPEIDKNNNQQVEAKNIVVMRVVSKQIEGPYYNDLELEGTGDCRIYQNGEVISCTWQKSEKEPTSKLRFIDSQGEEIPFVQGSVWIELVEPYQKVVWAR